MSLKCEWCGRFVGYEEVLWDEPYCGDLSIRLEPPELVPCCLACDARHKDYDARQEQVS